MGKGLQTDQSKGIRKQRNEDTFTVSSSVMGVEISRSKVITFVVGSVWE